MSDSTVHNLVVIGSGPAGLTASIYAARANLRPLCIEGFSAGGLIPGGQLMFTTEVENYPGFPTGVMGAELMQHMRDQAERQGTELVTADVSKVDLSKRPFHIWAEDEEYRAHAVIIATGARSNYLGLPNEELLKNKGVSACAVCDGSLFKDKAVAVVGGGDVACEDALYLTSLCSEVTMIHRRDELRASRAMAERAKNNPKIRFLWSHAVVDVKDVAQDRVTAVTVKNLKTGESHDHPVDGLFLGIGHTPMTELFVGQLDLHPNGYIQVKPGTSQTSIEGVFAAGDVQDFVYRQAVTAAGSGCMAALEAERWLGAQGAH